MPCIFLSILPLFLLPTATLQSSARSSLYKHISGSLRGFVAAFTSASLAHSSPPRSFASRENSVQTLLKDIDYQLLRKTVNGGDVFIQDDFISEDLLQQLREDIEKARPYRVSGLSDKGKTQQDFSPASDRSVCPVVLNGAYTSAPLQLIKSKLDMLQHDLALIMERPTLSNSQELYYSIGNPGSSLRRHMDERHPELSKRGYSNAETRRSLSFLVYLSDNDWNIERNGGQLRAFPQKGIRLGSNEYTGGEYRQSGCLQVGWLRTNAPDLSATTSSYESSSYIQPLYLDAWVHGSLENTPVVSKLFVMEKSRNGNYERRVVSESMEVRNSETGEFEKDFTKFLLSDVLKSGGVVSLLEDAEAWTRAPEELPRNSERRDINAKGGRLVIFDSVILPHEVCKVKVSKFS